jgi:hypothetical protein
MKSFQFDLRTAFRVISWACLAFAVTGVAIRNQETYIGTCERLVLMWITLAVFTSLQSIRLGVWICCLAAFLRCRVGADLYGGTVLDFLLLFTDYGYYRYMLAVFVVYLGFVMSYPHSNPSLRRLILAACGYAAIAVGFGMLSIWFIHRDWIARSSHDFQLMLAMGAAGQVIEIGTSFLSRNSVGQRRDPSAHVTTSTTTKGT